MPNPIILPAIQKNIELAVNELKLDKVVAFPTETVYGLGASAYSDLAVKQIYNIKKRPAINPLIVHYSKLDTNGNLDLDKCMKEISESFVVNSTFLNLFTKFSPGPLTFILPKKSNCKTSPLCSAYLPKQAFRIPDNEIALQLIHQLNTPIAAPSANISNMLSATTAEHVASSLAGNALIVLDGGPSLLGLESTILDVSDPKNIYLLRYGSTTIENLLEVGINPQLLEKNAKQLLSPGMMHKHYSPKADLRLNVTEVLEGEALLAFGDKSIPMPKDTLVFNLSKIGNITEAAHNLFRTLWDFDKAGVKKIAVMPIPNEQLGAAINERLKKAAFK